MKKIYFLLVAGIFLVSCSSDDNSDNNGNNNSSETYIPSETGNYWVYDVQSSVMNGRDSLYVANDTLINNKTYQKLKVKDNLAYGFFSNALNNNGIRHENGKAYLSGSAGLYFSEELPFNVDVNDFVIFDANASNDQQLSKITGSFQQVVEGFTLTFNYTLSAKAKTTISSFTSGSEQYSNVKPVEITLNVGINASIPNFPISYPLLSAQNVVVSTQYYTQGIGAVKTITDINYSLSQIPGIELPIPQSASEHQEETLVKHGVN